MKLPTKVAVFTLLSSILWNHSTAGAQVSSQPSESTSPKIEQLVQAARAAAGQKQYDQALASYQAALTEDPTLHDVRFEMAQFLATSGRIEESAQEFGKIVAARPLDGVARRSEATALIFLGRYLESKQKLEEALQILPRDGQLAHTLARLLAVAPVEEARDGLLAVQLATAVYEVVKLYETGETLSMAYAETGDFDRAIELQRQLISQAEGEGDTNRVNDLRQRLLSYQRSEAWRARSPAEIAMATAPPTARR
jgi:tetratricopeptide (TPR) repeat protein